MAKKTSECSIVFVECIICYGELKEASSSSLLHFKKCHEFTSKAFYITKNLKRTYIENFMYFITFGSQDPRPYGGTNFIT